MSKDIKNHLVRLGAQRPDLRKHIRPVLDGLKVAKDRQASRKVAGVPHDARRQWVKGNNRGEGFPVGTRHDDINELEGVDGLRQLLQSAYNPDEVAVYRDQDGSLVAVGDAHGPWAVEIE